MANISEKDGKGRGRKYDQKMKPFLVYQYLMQNTDENHVETGDAIAKFLQEEYDISAERRSIYRDIHEINKAILASEDGISLEEAEELLSEDETLQTIRFDKHKKGFYVHQRKYNLDDIRLLAECVYTAKFVSKEKANQLIGVLCGFVSDHQAEKIVHDAFLLDRGRTTNKKVLENVLVINEAMSKKKDGKKHVPEKITFQYLAYTLANLNQPSARRHGDAYKVSPFALLINEGNYYLLAYTEKRKMRTYRVDRMKQVKLTGEPREGQEEFDGIDLESYIRRTFSMFGGEEENVTLRFINPLLDTMVERFGTDATYARVDDRHMRVTAKVSVSAPFFGWLSGFGKRVKLLAPDHVVAQFQEHLNKIQAMY